MRRTLVTAATLSVVLVAESFAVTRWCEVRFSGFTDGIVAPALSLAARRWWLGLLPALAVVAAHCFSIARRRRAASVAAAAALGLAVAGHALFAWGVLAPLVHWQLVTRRIASGIGRHGMPPWAGHYYSGDGLGFNYYLTLSASEYLFEWQGCMGLYERTHGRVVQRGATLSLVTAGRHFTLVPINWGERHYLVGPDRRRAWCDEVAARREPRTDVYGPFFLRVGDERLPATGPAPLCTGP